MEPKKLKDLKNGEMFTRKPVEYPTEKQVLIKNGYVRSLKKYSCYHWNDVCKEIFLKGETLVYTDFTF